MTDTIDLIRIGTGASHRDGWTHGSATSARADLRAVTTALANILNPVNDSEPATGDAVLVLDEQFPLPSEELLHRLLDGPADVWHGGLALGLGDQPAVWDHVEPTSMFSAPLDPTIEATSWRVSMRALLVRTSVLEQLGGPAGGFDTLTGAGLEMGLRWIRAGALMRHVPDLVPAGATPDRPPSTADGLRMVGMHSGRTWAGWTVLRALRCHEVSAAEAVPLARQALRSSVAPLPHYEAPGGPDRTGRTDRTVSVILPTVDRYSYLEPLLQQLAEQSVAPHEVLIVDQTPLDHRRHDLADIEPALPVTVIEIPTPGQCTARNAALEQATGELFLFIDDDDDIPSTLIEDHLRLLIDGIDAVSGAVDDATAGPPPVGFRHRRAGDVFPTNNTMLRRSAMERSAMFDPAYDHGPRADHDVGMRLHLSGAVLLYDPSVEVFHHHAPAGGLRTHGARKVTRAGSRRSLTQRDLPAVTQLYLGRRYFTDHQRAEGRLITLVGMLSGSGSPTQRLARAAVQITLLPSSIRRWHDADRAAASKIATRTPIPALTPMQAEVGSR